MNQTNETPETKSEDAQAEQSGGQKTSTPKEDAKLSETNDKELKTENSSSETSSEAEESALEVDEVEVLTAEVADLKDKLLRQAAEMENLRRRTEREKQDMAKYAISNFAKDIITLDDNLARTLSAVPEGAIDEDPALKALVEGVEMTGRELTNVLERHGIKRIDPKGDIFDPNSHQALFEIPNPEVPAGTVMEVVAPGFTIDSRILRPAMVGVAKGGEKPKKEAKTEESAEGETKPDADKVDKAV